MAVSPRSMPGGILHRGAAERWGCIQGRPATAKAARTQRSRDANLVLGFLDPDNFLAGKARLDRHLAEQALHEHVATPLGFTTVEAAYGVHQVVSTTMAEGIRLLSVKRGVDPRDFALLAFGGASGLHVSRVARHLRDPHRPDPHGSPGAVRLRHAQHRSAVWFLAVPTPRVLTRSIWRQCARSRLHSKPRGEPGCTRRAFPDSAIEVVLSADMRYLDQVYEVNVPIPDLTQEPSALLHEWASNFHSRYQELYAYHQQEQEIRLVTLRVTVLGRLPEVALPAQGPNGDASPGLEGPAARVSRRVARGASVCHRQALAWHRHSRASTPRSAFYHDRGRSRRYRQGGPVRRH